ncbi:hypothetical protein [Leucobacter komagatae]|uniref:WYL domain-containing protein n=1 Tax=Leucobacter komagatae TaxID=55969 RepID=UPI001476F513|nr:hypothetical protein [Leucobacter komagatae]
MRRLAVALLLHPVSAIQVEFFDELQDAVIRGVQVQLSYVDGAGKRSARVAHPLGLVAKGPAGTSSPRPKRTSARFGSTGSRG